MDTKTTIAKFAKGTRVISPAWRNDPERRGVVTTNSPLRFMWVRFDHNAKETMVDRDLLIAE